MQAGIPDETLKPYHHVLVSERNQVAETFRRVTISKSHGRLHRAKVPLDINFKPRLRR